ncbi:maleylpyruvate isomerase N-terminal domain-containing protein [Microbacterium sp. RD1]|uniref:maleylpyruvate isomerase N-terminal domain-containing protein n=1 Tax=Microbacterium sp. RD1 TaxID=3457313 RepID=UPI003FA577B8
MSARADLVTTPAIQRDLLTARRGQAYFARHVRNLRDADFSAPSLVEGWTRADVVAFVGLSARALTKLTEWARRGAGEEAWVSRSARDAEIAFTATLPVEALRTLSDHAAVHLSVEWRDLTDAEWQQEVGGGYAPRMPVSATPLLRARQVWHGALALDCGAEPSELPDAIAGRGASPDGAAGEVPRHPELWT